MSIIQEYIDYGFKLVPIPPHSKGPITKDWNLLENTLVSESDLKPRWGIGLAHAYSGTMALDIDDINVAIEEFKKEGIDLLEWLNDSKSVFVLSNRKGRCKLIYRIDEILPTKQILINGKVVIELRCATAEGVTVQDVLPPTLHPITNKPYKWKGDWKNIPQIPSKLLELWHRKITREVKKENIKYRYTVDDIKSALRYVDPNTSRDEWIRIGMGLHWYGMTISSVSPMFEIWDEWSAKSKDKYPGKSKIKAQWESFKSIKDNIVTPRTLFKIALRNGWSIDTVKLFDMFKTVDTGPVNLTYGFRPKPPDINLSLWPSCLANRALEVSESVGCDPLIPLWAGLSAICAVVDSRMKLELCPGFEVPPILWLMTIGEPGDKKTPGSKPMMKILDTLVDEEIPNYIQRLKEWETLEAIHLGAKSARLNMAKSSEYFLNFMNNPNAMDELPDAPELPSKPVPLQLKVTDITSQKLVRKLADQPSGFLCYLDEMNSWAKKLIDKNSSEDRSVWVMGYEGGKYHMDRVVDGSITCDNLALSIYGNMQPAIFRRVLGPLASDGLLQRFLPAAIRDDQTRKGNPVQSDSQYSKEWEEAVRSLSGLPILTYKLSKDAYRLFSDFQDWYEGAKRDERLLQTSDVFMTAFSKLEGTVGRLALIFHIVENPYSTIVEKETMLRVIKIVRQFIIPSFRYVYNELGGVSSFETWLANFVLQNSNKEIIDIPLIKRKGWRVLEDINPFAIDRLITDNMALLELERWVVKVSEDDGKLKNQQWVINPQLTDQGKERIDRINEAKQRQMEERSLTWDLEEDESL